jgi:hypothetical protein
VIGKNSIRNLIAVMIILIVRPLGGCKEKPIHSGRNMIITVMNVAVICQSKKTSGMKVNVLGVTRKNLYTLIETLTKGFMALYTLRAKNAECKFLTKYRCISMTKKYYKEIRQLSTVAWFSTGSRRYHSTSKFSSLAGAERLKSATRGKWKFRHLIEYLKQEA